MNGDPLLTTPENTLFQTKYAPNLGKTRRKKQTTSKATPVTAPAPSLLAYLAGSGT